MSHLLTGFVAALMFQLACSPNETNESPYDVEGSEVQAETSDIDSQDSTAQPSACTGLGTFAETVANGFHAWPDLFGNGTEVEITATNGCSFDMSADGATQTVLCSTLSSSGLETGRTYIYESCEMPQSNDMLYAFFTIRDASGSLVLAGGTGTETVDSVTCLPDEFKVSKIYGVCEPYTTNPVRCGPRENIGLRVQHGSQVLELFSGEVGQITVGEQAYDVYNFYMIKAINWEQVCSDTFAEYGSWAVVRRM